jgi:hypothetical protein
MPVVIPLQGVHNPPGRMSDSDREAQQAFASYYDTAELYYAYHLIYTTANQPFKNVDDATLFNAARSVVLSVQQRPGRGFESRWTWCCSAT